MYKTNVSFISILLLSIVFLCSTAAISYAQPPGADRAEVPLTNPSKPALVKVSLITGSIFVTGYSGKTVIVEASISVRKHDDEGEDEDDDEDKEDKEDKKRKNKAKGMHRILNGTTGLTIVEENNTVSVRVSSHYRKIDVTLKVPYKTSLKLRSVNDGEITVENVDGDLAVGHTNGPITLKKVSGTVVANTTNGDLTVTFERVNLNKPMSFNSFNGDVDVTFPATAKFNLKMKTDQGDIYSDFQLKMQTPSTKSNKEVKKDGKKYRIRFDKSVYGQLNGGGEEVQFKTFNGDIYIRKKK